MRDNRLRKLLDALTAAQRVGSPDADVTVVEFFDYNCGYCRAAVEGLETVVRNDPKVSLLLVHTPILAPGSLEAAALQQAVYRRHGASHAHDLHLALYRMRGLVDGARVRSSVDPALLDGLSAHDVGAATDEVLQLRRAAAEFGVRAVPTFVAGETLFIGWPGRTALAAMVESARRCGQAMCG